MILSKLWILHHGAWDLNTDTKKRFYFEKVKPLPKENQTGFIGYQVHKETHTGALAYEAGFDG